MQDSNSRRALAMWGCVHSNSATWSKELTGPKSTAWTMRPSAVRSRWRRRG